MEIVNLSEKKNLNDRNNQKEQSEDKLLDLFLRGLPSTDKQGHHCKINFQVRPLQIDIIEKRYEKAPKNWFKNKSQLYRGLFAVGCKFALKWLEDKGVKLSDLNNELLLLSEIASDERKDELRKDGKALQNKVLLSDMDDKIEKYEEIGKLTENIIKKHL